MKEEEKHKRKLESQKKYREKNRDILKIKSNEYYFLKKEHYKEYRNTNKEKIKDKQKEYYKKNKEKIKDKQKEYYKNNKENQLKNSNKWKQNKRKNDYFFKLKEKISKDFRKILSRSGYVKKHKSTEILGCTFEEFKNYLENNFEYWMNWNNKGLFNGKPNCGWDIDHVIPLSTAKTEDDIIKLNHYTNLQPLCSYINRIIKRNKTN